MMPKEIPDRIYDRLYHKYFLGETPTLRRLEHEYFEIKTMMLENPSRRLSNLLKTIRRAIAEGRYA